MAYRPIRTYKLFWDVDNNRGEVQLDLTGEGRPELRFPVTSLAEVAQWAALLSGSATREWDPGTHSIVISG